MNEHDGWCRSRWSLRSSMLGAVGWLILLVGSSQGYFPLGIIEQLFLLAPLVIVPLALVPALTSSHRVENGRFYRLAVFLQPFVAVLLVGSFVLPAGLPAGVLACGWLLMSSLVGLLGLSRFLQGRDLGLEAICFNAGFLYLSIGAAWLVASRSGMSLFGFGEPIVLLTAVHFHYTGFVATLLTGSAGLVLGGSLSWARCLYRFVGPAVVIGPPLLATGFVFSPVLKVMGVLMLASGLIGLGVLFIVLVPRLRSVLSQGLLVISTGSLVGGMVLACAYGVGEFTGNLWISIPQMARTHGILNSLGFSLCGLLAFVLHSERSHAAP